MIRKIGTPLLIILLLAFSALLYLIQHLIFNRPGETAFYFLQDLAFVPISVLLVTLGLNTILVYRDRQAMLEKVSIVVNEFFAEVGNDLLLSFQAHIADYGKIASKLRPDSHWQDKDFHEASALIAITPIKADIRQADLMALYQILEQKKNQILRLFENANLMEHDRFTDMLWAVYHVYDELRCRKSYEALPPSDIKHLNGDLQRAAQLLLIEWIDSMRSLKQRYPYLYSLAIRKNPFGTGNVIVDE